MGFGQSTPACEGLEGSCVVQVSRNWGLMKIFHILEPLLCVTHLLMAKYTLSDLILTAFSLGMYYSPIVRLKPLRSYIYTSGKHRPRFRHTVDPRSLWILNVQIHLLANIDL